MAETFSFVQRKEGDILIVSPVGYLAAEGGKELKNLISLSLGQGTLKFIIDFTKTELINSPGISHLLDIASQIIDDYNGRLATFGLDKHHNQVLEMSGFFFLAVQVSDLAGALNAVND